MNIDKYIRNEKVMAEVNKWTYQSLANAMGVSRQTIWNWNNDKAVPTREQGDLLAELLGCSYEQLIMEDNNET